MYNITMMNPNEVSKVLGDKEKLIKEYEETISKEKDTVKDLVRKNVNLKRDLCDAIDETMAAESEQENLRFAIEILKDRLCELNESHELLTEIVRIFKDDPTEGLNKINPELADLITKGIKMTCEE